VIKWCMYITGVSHVSNVQNIHFNTSNLDTAKIYPTYLDIFDLWVYLICDSMKYSLVKDRIPSSWRVVIPHILISD
jgi:hypothetical protein